MRPFHKLFRHCVQSCQRLTVLCRGDGGREEVVEDEEEEEEALVEAVATEEAAVEVVEKRRLASIHFSSAPFREISWRMQIRISQQRLL